MGRLAPMRTRLAKTCEDLAEVAHELEAAEGQCSKLQLQIQDLQDLESQDCLGRPGISVPTVCS